MNTEKLKLAAVLLLYLPINCFAQAGPPPPGDQDPVVFPIDQEIYILLAAGLLFGIFIIFAKRKL